MDEREREEYLRRMQMNMQYSSPSMQGGGEGDFRDALANMMNMGNQLPGEDFSQILSGLPQERLQKMNDYGKSFQTGSVFGIDGGNYRPRGTAAQPATNELLQLLQQLLSGQ